MKKFQYLMPLLLWLLSGTQSHAQEMGYFLHTVAKGQSLYGIASMYHVTMADIVAMNPGSDRMIMVGETLRIPQGKSATSLRYHTIQQGETLYRLTQMYGVSAERICAANPGLTSRNFKAGQVIVIPEPELTAATPTQAAATPTVADNNAYHYLYKVKKGDTIYSICRAFGISRQALLEANPEIGGGVIKRGQFLAIPQAVTQRTTAESTTTEAQTPLAETQVENLLTTPKAQTSYDKVKVAVLLPFMLDGGESNEQKRMVEYYEGMLMAVDSLKRMGFSYDIYTYDTRSAGNSVKPILAKPEMSQMNLIIGPTHAAQIKEVAEFAKLHRIRTIIPFSSKGEEVFNNSYLFQINTPQSYLYSEVYDHFTRLFRADVNVVFVDTRDGNHEKDAFVRGLQAELTHLNRTYQQVTLPAADADDDFTLLPYCVEGRNNLFIPTSGTNVALIKLLPYLKEVMLEEPNHALQLFGYPEWQSYTGDHIDDFYTLDTYFYGSFYTNNLAKTTHDFQAAFRKLYHRTIMNTYPKYAILGFDTAFYFLKGLSLYGSNFEENFANLHVNPIQTSFKFERVNNWGGFINRKVFFVHFTKQHELIKMDFDR